MKKILVLALIASLSIGGFSPSLVMAQKAYSDAWKEVYVKESKDDKFKALVEEAKCNVCHQGSSKKERNPYGTEAVAVFKKHNIDKTRPKSDPEGFKKDIEAAFKALEEVKAKDGKTFGEKIKAGQLPGA